MDRCDYFSRCGTAGVYECEHGGNMPEGSASYSCCNKVRLKLEEAAETIDDEIEALHEATRPTAELMRWEPTFQIR